MIFKVIRGCFFPPPGFHSVGPVVLLVVAVSAEVLLKGLIDLLGLTIPSRWYSEVKWSFIPSAVPRLQRKICHIGMDRKVKAGKIPNLPCKLRGHRMQY